MKNIKLVITIIIILLLIVLIFAFKDKILKIMYPKKYDEIISNYAKEYNVDEDLVFAVIKAESNFDENAVSHKNAIRINADYGRYSS